MDEKVVILIDDEPIILESLTEQLSIGLGEEFIIESAENANEGFVLVDELMNQHVSVVVIVSDWLMPGIKGDEFLIKIHEKYPDILKIMLTGQADDDAVERTKEFANLFTCLRKPWDKDELINMIQKGLEI